MLITWLGRVVVCDVGVLGLTLIVVSLAPSPSVVLMVFTPLTEINRVWLAVSAFANVNDFEVLQTPLEKLQLTSGDVVNGVPLGAPDAVVEYLMRTVPE